MAAMKASSGRAGRIIADKFRLLRPVGRGGMGTVWLAEHTTLGAPVAIKLIDGVLLDPKSSKAEETRKRFLREAQAAAALRSPHVVQLLDYGVQHGVPYMVLEYLEGESLDKRLERVGKLSLEDASRVVTHVARALSRAHDLGVVHRDLKPSNVFLVHNDDVEIIKVVDFGLAKMNYSPLNGRLSEITRNGNIVGTLCYMSPEQAYGQEVDWRTDLWALGVIAFYSVCGRHPFDSETLGTLLRQIWVNPVPVPSTFTPCPPGFDMWFAKAVNRDRAERFQSAREMAEALRAVVADVAKGPPTVASTAPAPQPETPPSGSDMVPTRVKLGHVGVSAAAPGPKPTSETKEIGEPSGSDLVPTRIKLPQRSSRAASVKPPPPSELSIVALPSVAGSRSPRSLIVDPANDAPIPRTPEPKNAKPEKPLHLSFPVPDKSGISVASDIGPRRKQPRITAVAIGLVAIVSSLWLLTGNTNPPRAQLDALLASIDAKDEVAKDSVGHAQGNGEAAPATPTPQQPEPAIDDPAGGSAQEPTPDAADTSGSLERLARVRLPPKAPQRSGSATRSAPPKPAASSSAKKSDPRVGF